MIDLYNKPLLNFDNCADDTDGVIFKAGCQNSATDANGIGVDGTLSGAANVDFSEGGISTKVATTGTTVSIDIPAKYRAGLRTHGRIQFDIKKSSLDGMLTQNVALIGLYDASNSDANGPRVRFNGSTARGGSDFSSSYINNLLYGVLQLDASWAAQKFEATDSQAAICVASSDEWVTLTISWTPTEVTWLQDGHTVTRSGHANPTADLTYLKIEMASTVLADRLPLRNIILCDHSAPDIHREIGYSVPNVVTMGHSFWSTGGGLPELPYDSIERCGSLSQLTSQIHYQYVRKYGRCNFKNLAHDGSVTAGATVITGHGETVTLPQDSYDWTNAEVIPDRILSKQSDFALLMVHGSDTVEAVVDTQLQIIIDALIANGTIPIIIREQNRDAGGQDRTDVDAQVVATCGVYQAIADNHIGLVDMWTPTGGSTVNTDYVENSGTLIHPSFDVGELYGVAIADEIHALAINPPSYSRWANS